MKPNETPMKPNETESIETEWKQMKANETKWNWIKVLYICKISEYLETNCQIL